MVLEFAADTAATTEARHFYLVLRLNHATFSANAEI
jgi:hypothetical protein